MGRYLIGPEVEVRLPLGLSVEFDALYRHFSYTNFEQFTGTTVTTTGSSGNWEFPLVAKYRFRTGRIRPYVEAGVAWDALAGLQNTSGTTYCSIRVCEGANYPPTPFSQTTAGVVIGGGGDIRTAEVVPHRSRIPLHALGATVLQPLRVICRAARTRSSFWLGSPFYEAPDGRNALDRFRVICMYEIFLLTTVD
jgi:hypothetical protein